MKYIKISLFMFLILVSFNNTVFGDVVKIYTMDDVIRDNKGIFFDKISNNKLWLQTIFSLYLCFPFLLLDFIAVKKVIFEKRCNFNMGKDSEIF